jgi:hypothetical protein
MQFDSLVRHRPFVWRTVFIAASGLEAFFIALNKAIISLLNFTALGPRELVIRSDGR